MNTLRALAASLVGMLVLGCTATPALPHCEFVCHDEVPTSEHSYP